MSHGELLPAVVALLDPADIPHMVVGSSASAFHGEPRMTLQRDTATPARSHLTEAGDDLARVLAVLGDWAMQWLPVDRPLRPVSEPVILAAENLGSDVRKHVDDKPASWLRQSHDLPHHP